MVIYGRDPVRSEVLELRFVLARYKPRSVAS
jgi:hypothetical protein